MINSEMLRAAIDVSARKSCGHLASIWLDPPRAASWSMSASR
ncbi:hypothetical protein ACVIIV_004915 [Bradyrhizobium sp. USDA 4354]